VDIIDTTDSGVKCQANVNDDIKQRAGLAALMPETGELFYCGGEDNGKKSRDCYSITSSSKVTSKVMSFTMLFFYLKFYGKTFLLLVHGPNC